RARGFFEGGLQLTREAGDIRSSAVCLINLGDIAMLENDLDRASDLLKEAYDVMIQVGDTQSAGNALANRAQVELGRGNLTDAAVLLAESIRLSRQSDDRYSILHQLITAAGVFDRTGALELAATVFGRVEALQRETNIAINPTELRLMAATMSDLKARLPDDQLQQGLGAGGALDYDAGLELVLSALAGSSSAPASSSSSSSSSSASSPPSGAT
ncbi:MAG: hypothetical protein QOJ81_1573, partial [Chloroflexota bacterium]|nr:hypothetical protein [Chloroflexota bacterium]